MKTNDRIHTVWMATWTALGLFLTWSVCGAAAAPPALDPKVIEDASGRETTVAAGFPAVLDAREGPGEAAVPARDAERADGGCRFLCAPQLKVEPTWTFEPLFQHPLIETLANGEVVDRRRQKRGAGFELVLALSIPTAIPRVGFTVEAILKPFEEVDNEPEVEVELNLYVIEARQTGGWLESHFDIVDKFSPSQRPGDEGAYTHKLNLEWDTALRPFNRLPEDRYLAHVEVEASLDFVATGLSRAGDLVGEERFVTDASPWSFSLLLVFPVAPL